MVLMGNKEKEKFCDFRMNKSIKIKCIRNGYEKVITAIDIIIIEAKFLRQDSREELLWLCKKKSLLKDFVI